MKLLIMALLLGSGCRPGGLITPPGPAQMRFGPSPKHFVVKSSIVRPTMGPDSLIINGSWTLPSDGRGNLDSVSVVATVIGPIRTSVFRAVPFPTSIREAFDLAPGTSTAGPATLCILTYRFGVTSGSLWNGVDTIPTNCGRAIFEYAPSGPPAAVGVGVTTTIKRP